jgi:hypothetical protein
MQSKSRSDPSKTSQCLRSQNRSIALTAQKRKVMSL